MKLRSLLFVPGDRPDRMEKALASGADALIIDLEDAVAPSAKADARWHVGTFLQKHEGANLWVRINPLDSLEADKDLAAVLSHHPNGIVLPKAEGGAFGGGACAAADEARTMRLRRYSPIATETPAAMFQLGHLWRARSGWRG
jgi:citrate lyase subunit beta/citryl-CoA lyase